MCISVIGFISLLKSHVDIHNRIYIYTYKHIKYINPFFTELQETKDKIHYTVTVSKFFKQDLIYMVHLHLHRSTVLKKGVIAFMAINRLGRQQR